MTTTYDPEVPIDWIVAHPHNPRRDAEADQDLVDSIRESGLLQPLVVAPSPDFEEQYILIAGHRRYDGLRQLKHFTAPAIIREDLDTEAKQLEAMLIENGRRKDLTAIEEAEGYHQLSLFDGYTQKRIAERVGVNAKTVSSRLKLLKLSEKTKEGLHVGEVTLDDALALTEFAGTRFEGKLEKSVGTYNFKYDVEHARRTLDSEKRQRAQLQDYEKRGIPRYHTEGAVNRWTHFTGDNPWMLSDSRLSHLTETDHAECLAYYWESATYMFLVCTDPTSHLTEDDDDKAPELTPEEIAEREERAQRQAEHEARKQAVAAAQNIRIRSAIAAAKATKLPAPFSRLVQALMPSLLDLLDEFISIETYFNVLDLPEDDRWLTWHGQDEKKAAHVDWILSRPAADVPRVLAAMLVAAADSNAGQFVDHDDSGPVLARIARAYTDYLETVDHPFCDVDQELLANLAKAEQAAAK